MANPVSSLGDLLKEIEPVGSVVGARYHNVVAGLRLSKPTISVGYSLKHDALMGDMGVPEFALSARSVTAPQLIERFTELQSRSSEVHASAREQTCGSSNGDSKDNSRTWQSSSIPAATRPLRATTWPPRGSRHLRSVEARAPRHDHAR